MKTKRKKRGELGGRPPLVDGKLAKVICLSMSETELNAFREDCRYLGVTQSGMIRFLLAYWRKDLARSLPETSKKYRDVVEERKALGGAS